MTANSKISTLIEKKFLTDEEEDEEDKQFQRKKKISK